MTPEQAWPILKATLLKLALTICCGAAMCAGSVWFIIRHPNADDDTKAVVAAILLMGIMLCGLSKTLAFAAALVYYIIRTRSDSDVAGE